MPKPTDPRLGWKRELPDQRDHVRAYAAIRGRAGLTLPAKVDLRTKMTPVYDQGELGSCTANAIAAVYQFQLKQQGIRLDPWVPSRLAIYWGERVLEHTQRYDAGAYIRDGFKVIKHRGVAPESLWPYDTKLFAKAPPRTFWKDAWTHQALEYVSPPKTLNDLKAVLASGSPFVFGFTVYESFYRIYADGMMPMPATLEQAVGGHAVTAVGYDDDIGTAYGCFIVRNSWGEDWGDHGHFYMPYEFMLGDNTDDFWVLHKVE